MDRIDFSIALAGRLYRDDLSRANEVPVERDGYLAHDQWVRAAAEAGDTETGADLELVDEDIFAAEWSRLVGGV